MNSLSSYPINHFAFHSRRPVVFATGGMVAASQPMAVQAGLEILRAGGNAADAAVAVAATLAVTEPCSTGLGGDAFALYYEAASGRVSALNGSGRAPAALTLERVRRDGFTRQLPAFHAYTITVPGACAAWCDLASQLGSQPLKTLLAPAIRLADQGFPVAPLTAWLWDRGTAQLARSPGGRELMVGERAPRAGEIMRNPTLARTLRQIARGGNAAFYEGEIAECIARTVRAFGGTMTRRDLAAHRSTWEDPISTVYQGVRLYQCPPNGQGLTALLALNILSQLKPNALRRPLSVSWWHHIIEALRLAFADTRWYIADPAFSAVPVNELLSVDYAARRAAKIDPNRALRLVRKGSPISGSGTVYFSVVDPSGNACSMVNSNYQGFGTGIVPEGLGFSLQNRGLNFSLDPKHPNALAPRKRPYHTIVPAMATREANGSLFSSFGVMGGFMQPQGHLQVLLALLENDQDPQAALDRPRICLQGGSAAGIVGVEEGIPDRVLNALENRGHRVERVAGNRRTLFGRGQAILRDPATGVLRGGSDPRCDGCAMGL